MYSSDSEINTAWSRDCTWSCCGLLQDFQCFVRKGPVEAGSAARLPQRPSRELERMSRRNGCSALSNQTAVSQAPAAVISALPLRKDLLKMLPQGTGF